MRRFGCAFALLFLCTGFEWPGRVAHLIYQSAHGNGAERNEAVQLLGQYPAEAVRDALLLALEDDDLDVRLSAAAALGQARVPEGVPQLMEWLDAKLPELRNAAVMALGAIDDARSVSALTRAVSDPVPNIRLAAISALAKPRSETLPTLIGALDDPDAQVRAEAARVLSPQHEPNVLTALMNHARDDAPEVRRIVVRSLGHAHTAQAQTVLTHALKDADRGVQLAAIAALGDLDSTASVAALRGCLGLHPVYAKTAIAALGRNADPSAEQALVDTLTHSELAGSAARALQERLRVPERQDAAALITSLAEALVQTTAGPLASLLADVLIDAARTRSIASAVPTLQAAINDGRGDPHSLARVLAHVPDRELLPVLLERLARADDAQLPELVAALADYVVAGHGDGRALEPLLARLSNAHGQLRLTLIDLVGRTRAARALPALVPLLDSDNLSERLATVSAIGRLATEAARPVLWPLLDSPERALRLGAAHALATSANPNLVRELAAKLAQGGVDRDAVLLALSEALASLAPDELDTTLRAELLATLTHIAMGPDDALASRALDGLRGLRGQSALEAIARMLRIPSARRRGAAVFALADFPHEDTRRLLRFVLQHDGPRVSVAAALALGEVGDQRDVAALVHTAQRTLWPVPVAATFGLVRMAQRGVTKRHSMQRMLCELAGSHDPYVRANVAAGLAALAAPGCNDAQAPLHWLEASHASVVRTAAARWARALDPSEPSATHALRVCAHDSDPHVASSCRAEPLPAPTMQRLSVDALAADGQTPLDERLIALRLANASVFVGYTDSNGHVALTAAPSGDVTLENPADAAPEP